MYAMFMLILREGIESFLIVAITAAYLKKTGRSGLLRALFAGTFCAALLSCILGVQLSQYAVQPLSEGIMALVAAFLVLSMLIFMRKASKTLRTSIGSQVEEMTRIPLGAHAGIFLFALLMVTREGMEVAFMVNVLIRQSGLGNHMVLGAVLGLLAALSVGLCWLHYGSRVNLALLFRVTSIFLYMFCFQLFFYAFHELAEGNALPLLDNAYWHNLTEVYGPEGVYGSYYSYLMALVPLGYLAYNFLKKRNLRTLSAAGR